MVFSIRCSKFLIFDMLFYTWCVKFIVFTWFFYIWCSKLFFYIDFYIWLSKTLIKNREKKMHSTEANMICLGPGPGPRRSGRPHMNCTTTWELAKGTSTERPRVYFLYCLLYLMFKISAGLSESWVDVRSSGRTFGKMTNKIWSSKPKNRFPRFLVGAKVRFRIWIFIFRGQRYRIIFKKRQE